MATPTKWPLRQALILHLRGLIAGSTLSAINADLAARLIVRQSSGTVQFGDSNIVVGMAMAVSEPTIEIAIVTETLTQVASDAYHDTFETAISLKLPWAADNAPEDFAIVADIVLDNIRDLLTSEVNYTLRPLDPSASPVLPGDSQFTGCRVTKITRDPVAADATGIESQRAWTLWHSAETTFYVNR